MTWALVNEGKPLFFIHRNFLPVVQRSGDRIMLNLISQMAQLRYWHFALNADNSTQADGGVAHGLMQSAEARAGQNPHEAAELRQAARAFLSVVR
ncbi:MAG: hypothetical protein JWP29_3947 [Rhodoferax sp.]|jgi:hypothetical protein|nr:hypothetical protein [Rhodoferax sp.]